jgi:hypothetical protein
MWMDAERRLIPWIDLRVIQEHERLDVLSDVGRADQARNRSMPMAIGAKGDPADAGRQRTGLVNGRLDAMAESDGACRCAFHVYLQRDSTRSNIGPCRISVKPIYLDKTHLDNR